MQSQCRAKIVKKGSFGLKMIPRGWPFLEEICLEVYEEVPSAKDSSASTEMHHQSCPLLVRLNPVKTGSAPKEQDFPCPRSGSRKPLQKVFGESEEMIIKI